MTMKILFIGGTGNISAACCRLALARGMDVYVLNRGQRDVEIEGAQSIVADIQDEAAVEAALRGHEFDVVANFIAFQLADVERDLRLFKGKARQYFFISSASAYQKPLNSPVVTESTPLKNPFWEYSRDKIACEDRLVRAYREEDFPAIIVRPSLTYDTVWPVAIGAWDDYTLIDRLKKGKKIIVHGDGTSLWTVTHSEDFAKGFVGLFGHTQAVGEAFHITSDEVLTWNQIYQTIADAVGVEAKMVHIPSAFIARMVDWQLGNLLGDKAISAIFDNSKIKRYVPDYCATIPFHEGARRTLAWFEAKPERMKVVDYTNTMMDAIIAKYESVFENLQPLD